MKKQSIILLARDYARRHWFKLSLLLLVIIACFRKELSFSLQLNSGKEAKKVEQKKVPSEAKFTQSMPSEASETTPLSIFSSILGGDKKNDEFPDLDDATKIAFMKRFYQVAVAEQKKYGVPASIILANALRQSYAGKRELTLKSNNHFALPYTFDWAGTSEKIGNESYRKYDNAWLSFRDHSIFVTSGKFAELRSLGNANYKAWAKGLEKLGYPAGNNNLANDLIEIIEKYQLSQLDKM